MSGIIQFFTGIADIISAIVNFIVTIFKDFVYVIKLLFSTTRNIQIYFNWLPSTIATLIVTAIAIAIIYKVLGRD